MMGNFLDLGINLLSRQSCNSLEKNKIIVFEGMPGAGKTTILSSMAEDYEGACILLSEMNLEPHSPETMFPLREQKNIFHQLWVERMHLLRVCKHLGLCFLLDRSYFSNLAFMYALNRINNTFYYEKYKKSFEKLFLTNELDLIVVLEVLPEIGLKRRQLRGDNIPWPWSNLAFLEAMREFYKEELPKIFQQKIKYINTGKEINEVKKDIKKEIEKLIKKEEFFIFPYKTPEKKQIKFLDGFAIHNKLGKANTRLINVLGLPTLYFLKHSVQLDQNQPVFFNNAQLHNILYRNNFLKDII